MRSVALRRPKPTKCSTPNRLIARRCPKHGSGQAWGLGKGPQQGVHFDLGRLNPRNGFHIVIRGAEQNRAQTQKIARNLEINNLARAALINKIIDGGNSVRRQ